jgi:hypothetical protein
LGGLGIEGSPSEGSMVVSPAQAAARTQTNKKAAVQLKK